ncbi:MAG: DUF6261 family protein [Paludibacter sp.]
MKKFVFLFISFSRLWKNEFRELVNTVVGIFDQLNPVALNLGFVYDKLVESQTELRLLQVREGKHPKSKELGVIRKNRKKLICNLIAQIKLLNSSSTVYSIPQLEVITPFVVRYLVPIVKVNSIVKSDVLDEMYLRLEVDTALQTAINTLNLSVQFDELKSLKESYRQVEKDKKESSDRQNVRTIEVRSNAEFALTNLMNVIVIAQVQYPEVDYKPLIDSLNNTFSVFSTQEKTRTTIRKQTASRKAKNVSIINTTTTAQNGNSGTVAI